MALHLFLNSRKAAQAFALVLALLAMLHTSRGIAQASHTLKLPALDVTVAFDKTHISVGEPVTMSIVLENVTEHAIIDVSASFQLPEGNAIELNVQPPGELPYQYAGALEIGSYPARPLRVVRTIPQKIEVLLLYDRTQPTGYLFSKPGTYRLSGEIRLNISGNPMPEVAAIPETTIEVSPLEGTEAEVFALVDTPELARSLHLGVAPTTGILNELKVVGEKYPNTSLGALALRSVGQQNALSPAGDREYGAGLLQQYLASGLVPAEGDYTAWAVAAAYHMTGKYDLAREWIFYSMHKYPHSTRIRPEDALYKFYFYDPASFASQVPWYLLESPWKIPGATPPTSLKPVQDAQ